MCLLAEIRYQQEFMFSEVHEEEVSVYCFHSPQIIRFASLLMLPESRARMRTCLKRRPYIHGVLKNKCHAWQHGDWVMPK